MQQQADKNIVDLVFKNRLTWAKLRQVPQEHDGSTSDLIFLLTEQNNRSLNKAIQQKNKHISQKILFFTNRVLMGLKHFTFAKS